MKNHDHDMIAEDRPTPVPFASELTIATKIIGATRIDFMCADTGDEYSDFHFVTRLRVDIAFGKCIGWIDPTIFETALDSIEDANYHLTESDQITTHQAMRIAKELYTEAELFFKERDTPTSYGMGEQL